MKRHQAIVAAIFALSPPLVHAANPFLGKWELAPERSKYVGAACPRRMTIEVSAAGVGEHYHSETELPNGTSFSADYTANYDDVAAMVKGAHGVLLPVSLHREGANVVVARYMSGLETRASSRRVLSADGKTLTITTTSRDGGGVSFTNVGVYQRVANAADAGFDLSKAKTELKVGR